MSSTSEPSRSADPFTPPSSDEARARRVHASLFRIAERHAATDAQRRRQTHPGVISPHEAVRLVSFLLSGAALLDDGEPEVDRADITAALSLVPRARAEMDEVELGLLQMARGRGMTWPEIAFGLGLRSPQAARQRYERLVGRTDTDTDTDTDSDTDTGVDTGVGTDVESVGTDADTGVGADVDTGVGTDVDTGGDGDGYQVRQADQW